MTNTITRKDLNDWFLNNEAALQNADVYFKNTGNEQPNIFNTGFYSAPSWNWAYLIGITGVKLKDGTTRYFEVVTQFGVVKAARNAYIPVEAL